MTPSSEFPPLFPGMVYPGGPDNYFFIIHSFSRLSVFPLLNNFLYFPYGLLVNPSPHPGEKSGCLLGLRPTPLLNHPQTHSAGGSDLIQSVMLLSPPSLGNWHSLFYLSCCNSNNKDHNNSKDWASGEGFINKYKPGGIKI